MPKPVIAAITGYALGGGYELALCADFRVIGGAAPRSASRRSCSGVIPGAGGTQRLARLVGPAKAKDLVFTGRHVGAEEALDDGAGRRRRPRRRGVPTAVAMARKFAAGPPLALAAAKRAIDEGLELPSWRRAWSWRAGCSPSCSTPRTRRPACAPSWSPVRGRRPSRAAEQRNVQVTRVSA